MQKVKKHIGIRIFFLALFLSYFADITFFTHSHIINGVTIVHSHFSCPVSSKEDSKPIQHSHTTNVLTLIAQAQSWSSLLQSLPDIPADTFVRIVTYDTEVMISSDQTAVFHSYLRGPPEHTMC